MVRGTTNRSNQREAPGNHNLITSMMIQIVKGVQHVWHLLLLSQPGPNSWIFTDIHLKCQVSILVQGFTTLTLTPLSMPHRRTALGCVELLRQPTQLSETTGKKYKPLLNTLSVFAVTASRMISSPLQTLPIETALGTPNRKVRRDHRTNCRARTNKTTKGI